METGSRRIFPPVDEADEYGLVATTRSMDPEMLLEAYSHGLFPWSSSPVRWYSPEPRAVFLWKHIKLPKKMGKIIRRNKFRVSFDTAFKQVIEACSDAHRDEGEWISDEFIQTYSDLHEMGYAHSVEVWQEDRLVGGLYGVHIRGLFAGESMFFHVPNASKVAFAALVEFLQEIGVILFDAQVLNEFTAQLGAVQVYRDDYLWLLEHAMQIPTLHDGKKWPSDPVPHSFIFQKPGSSSKKF